MFQQKISVCLPHDSSKPVSTGHHDKDQMPFVCPSKYLAGEYVFLKSHTWITGEVSSSDAVTICVGSIGFHAIALHFCFLLGSLKVITGRFARKSQTTDTPL